MMPRDDVACRSVILYYFSLTSNTSEKTWDHWKLGNNERRTYGRFGLRVMVYICIDTYTYINIDLVVLFGGRGRIFCRGVHFQTECIILG